MAFDIILQRNQSEKNALSKVVNELATVTGVLKNETSIVNPTIIIECNVADFALCNYMSIPEFDRSYFVTDIRSIKNGLVEFTCHVDVLSSFAPYIRANRAIIEKQENAWNLYLDDGTFRVYQNPMVLTKMFPSGFDTWEFVLAVAGA